MDELMIKVDNVSKEYKLGQIGGTTLKEELQRWYARVRKKEDPTKKIGAKDYVKGEKFLALNGVSFDVKKGERVGIIGHNGAGKSTLLKLLSRVTAPTGGTISLNGRITSMLEVGTGFHGELTGRENVYMNGAILGMTKKEIDEKIEDIIDFSEVRQFIDTPVKRYSSGMYVKLAFAVAAHLDSEIMIMDEVLAVGDMQFQQKCLNKMSDVSKSEGRTILYVSHNMNTIRQLCDRVIVMDHGEIVFDGDVEEGISIYMGVNSDERPVEYDLLDVERPSKFHGKKLHITKFAFLDTTKPIFERTEPLRFHLEFDANENIDGVKMYFSINTLSNIVIGTTQMFSSICDAKKGEHYSFDFEMDISNIVKGEYCFRVDLFSKGGGDNYLSYDHPVQPICFEVVDTHSDNGIKWHTNYNGYIKLNEIKLI